MTSSIYIYVYIYTFMILQYIIWLKIYALPSFVKADVKRCVEVVAIDLPVIGPMYAIKLQLIKAKSVRLETLIYIHIYMTLCLEFSYEIGFSFSKLFRSKEMSLSALGRSVTKGPHWKPINSPGSLKRLNPMIKVAQNSTQQPTRERRPNFRFFSTLVFDHRIWKQPNNGLD